MNAKTMMAILRKLNADDEVLVIMQPDGPRGNDSGPDFDACEHELACEIDPEPSDLVLAKLDGQPSWLVARRNDEARERQASRPPCRARR
jgi:hypothetical protein